MKNWERFLYQRDTDEIVTRRDARISQTPAAPASSNGQWMTAQPYDWIARAGPRIDLALDDRFDAGRCPVVKVSFFDSVGSGSLLLFYNVSSPDGEGLQERNMSFPTEGDHRVKTATFPLGPHAVFNATGYSTDMSIRGQASGSGSGGASAEQEVVVSLVRVIKGCPETALPTLSPTPRPSFSRAPSLNPSPRPTPLPTVDLASCTAESPMCELTDDTGCPSGCSTASPLDTSTGLYYGGEDCGSNICTCYLWGGPLIGTETVESQEICAAKCMNSSDCSHAFYTENNNGCTLRT